LSLKNIKLDIDFVRNQFPAFKDSICKNWAFFENAGGSYVPQSVINRLTKFMISTKVQPYAGYEMSKIAGEQMDKATKLFAEMINANKNEIFVGSSTTLNIYVLSNAFRKFLQPGDEVIVTNQDHEANISPWLKLQDKGVIIKEWKINPITAELEINKLKKLLNKKTKIVAVTHCSNIVGSINNLKLISQIAHEHKAYVVGDGVSYAPHGFPDVKELDVDFYTFSLYKTYGPHLALMYGKYEILKKLPNQNHEFLKEDIPYTLNPGGPNHEELVSLIGINDYFQKIYDHHFSDLKKNIYSKIKYINNLIATHEEEIGNKLLEYINSRDDFNLIGKNKITNRNRAPTISITVKNKSSKKVSKILNDNMIATRNDNFYAWRCLEALGINTKDGVVRFSMTHYNSINDVNKLIKSLELV